MLYIAVLQRYVLLVSLSTQTMCVRTVRLEHTEVTLLLTAVWSAIQASPHLGKVQLLLMTATPVSECL